MMMFPREPDHHGQGELQERGLSKISEGRSTLPEQEAALHSPPSILCKLPGSLSEFWKTDSLAGTSSGEGSALFHRLLHFEK